KKKAIFMLGYTSMVMICGIIYLALLTQIIQLAYINHNTSPGESFANELLLFDQPVAPLISLCVFKQLWCLWVIYHATQYAIIIIVLPVLLYLGFIGNCSANYNSGATDISKQYMGIVTMLIESYALESAWNLTGLVMTIYHWVMILMMMPIQMIAYLLVIYQVSTGRAWSKKTGQQITGSLEFNHGTGHTTQTTGLETATQASQTHTDAGTVASNPLPLAQSAV
ncbi:hypothetical protein P691DRAFT_684202, partial [Macrolepiota fuliginosa MF-IS2]